MALPDVYIDLQNGTLGAVAQTEDGIGCMMLTGVTEGSITSGVPFLITSLADATNQGLTQANNPVAYKNIKEFYAESGDGAMVYVMIVPSTMTVDLMADNTNANGIRKLIDFGAGTIRWVGLLGVAGTITNGLSADVYTAVANLQVTLNNYAAKQWPMRGYVGGAGFNGTATDLIDQTQASNNRVGIVIGDTVSGNSCAIGVVLGRRAILPCQRKISRRKDGPLVTTTAFIGTVAADQYANTTLIHDKGYITLRKFARKAGFFFTGDKACTSPTDDYALLPRGAVVDKAQMIAYDVFGEEVDDEVPILDSGLIDPSWAKYLEHQLTNAVNLSMVANKNITYVKCYVPTDQNVQATGKVNAVVKLGVVGYAEDIEVALGFDNPNN